MQRSSGITWLVAPGLAMNRHYVFRIPDELAAVEREQLAAVAATKPEMSRREKRKFKVMDGGRDYQPLDVHEWVGRHQVPVEREGPWGDGGHRWILEECIWNGHTDNSAYIVHGGAGWIFAGCQHNSCPGGPGDNAWDETQERLWRRR